VRDRQDNTQKKRSLFCEDNVNHKLSDERVLRFTPGLTVKGKGSLFPSLSQANCSISEREAGEWITSGRRSSG
jgi:hypothetical protein